MVEPMSRCTPARAMALAAPQDEATVRVAILLINPNRIMKDTI